VDTPAGVPLVLTHSPWRRRRLRARLLRWSAWLGACGLVFLVVFGGLTLYNRAMLARSADLLFEQVLAGGDVETAWRQADPRLQAFYPREVFRDFARRRPALFTRDRLTAREILWRSAHGELCVVVRARVDESPGPAEVRFYCSRSEHTGFRLLGIEPDLTAAVPGNLEPYPPPGGAGKGGRR
jgi:hypothetical protein